MKKIVITGGAGFIGINLAEALLLSEKNHVFIYDNLSRKNTEENIRWLLSQKNPRLTFIQGDVRDYQKLQETFSEAKEIYHLAAQVAVTTSVLDPITDFSVNAEGTLYCLEACRKVAPEAFFLYSSTNKVYGKLSFLKLKKTSTRYMLLEKKKGISEHEPLDFYSPYGNSKGAADQYTRDYNRIYGMKTLVLRQSCIYGDHQRGTEDQGWVAYFMIRGILNQPITLYGDGKQVRDLLYVKDLVNLYLRAAKNIEKVKGRIYTVGGGSENTFSLLEMIEFLETLLKKKILYSFEEWRPGDQKIFISDNSAVMRDLRWEIQYPAKKGLTALYRWISSNLDSIKKSALF
ncbi:MAG: GDP-mannose 4,6-dehydratase [Candidatus Ratteibacteria bacterium]|jgi:CDP-paratose 2-epimerase